MGRELKRVPLSFNWPLKKVWSGYEVTPNIEPPIGTGYQLWETTTEGSPISPVFDTLDALCEWCEKNATILGDFKLSKEEWMDTLSEEVITFRIGNMVFL